jgi:YD repeat-containing protein
MRWAALVVLVAGASCGPAMPGRPSFVRDGESWTETPLDDSLPRLACPFAGAGSECQDGCLVRVQARVDETPSFRREHRVRPGRSTIVTWYADGDVSARATVELGEARLDVALHWPEAYAMSWDAIARVMARPYEQAPAPSARLTRTYEHRGAEGTYLLYEIGGSPVRRAERYERNDGLEHWSRASWEDRSTVARAAMGARARHWHITTTSQEGGQHVHSSDEDIDERGRLVRVRERSTWRPVSETTTRTVGYDERGRLTEVHQEGEEYPGRSPTRASPSADDESDLVSIERDEHGRVVGVRWRHGGVLRGRRDARGELVSVEWSSGSLERELDAHGRLIRSTLSRQHRNASDGSIATTRSVVEYEYLGACSPDLRVRPERSHETLLDRPIDLLQ